MNTPSYTCRHPAVHTDNPMPTPVLCTQEEVSRLVHAFYARVRVDPLIGPYFARHVADWEQHLPKMIDFWSSVLRGSHNYRGTPMPVHCALPALTPAMFERWLELFRVTADALTNRPTAVRAVELSRRIAQSLWYGYQLHQDPGVLPTDLPQRMARPSVPASG
jgi:hemoglobin